MSEGRQLRGLSEPSSLAITGQDPIHQGEEAMGIPSSSSHLAQTLLGNTVVQNRTEVEARAESSCDEDGTSHTNTVRRKREFIPEEKKDDGYWDKRRKNNEAAKRSREKRRANDMVLEKRVLGLLEENARLRAELLALKFRFGLVKDPSEVNILPLTSALSPKHYKTHRAPLSAQPVHNTPLQHRNGTSGDFAGQGMCKESSISIMNNPMYINDTVTDQSRARVQVEEAQVCSLGPESPDSMKSLPHKLRFKCPNTDGAELCESKPNGPPVATVGPSVHISPQPQPEWDRGERRSMWAGQESNYGPQSCQYYTSPPEYNMREGPTEEMGLRSQIDSLTQEVAQLKRLFSQQLLTKIS